MKNFRKTKAFIVSLKYSTTLKISLTDTEHLKKPTEVYYVQLLYLQETSVV